MRDRGFKLSKNNGNGQEQSETTVTTQHEGEKEAAADQVPPKDARPPRRQKVTPDHIMRKQEAERPKKERKTIKQPKKSSTPPTNAIPASLHKKKPFNQTHRRITTYMEKDLHEQIMQLKQEGINITALVNASVREFLQKNQT